MRSGVRHWLVAVIIATQIGCVSVRPEAKQGFKEELAAEQYTPFSPPRLGDGVGTIIGFDNKGREIVIARRERCFPSLTDPREQNTAILSSSTESVTSGGVAASATQALKGKADLSFAATADSDVKATLKFVKPYIQSSETLELKALVRSLVKGTDCYSAAYNPANVIIFSVLGVGAAEYTFTDRSNTSLRLTADLLTKAKVEPSLQRKFDGQASLVIEEKMLIAYRALEARQLPGALADKVSIEELDAKQVLDYKAAAAAGR